MKLYNHLSKKVEDCELDGDVTIYTCGPTVYDYPHVGNWYTFIRYDALVRTLRASGHKVKWVMNITDVGHLVSDADSGEDKMEKGAKRENKTAWDVAKHYADYFIAGLERLNFTEVSELPKATDYIDQDIDLVKTLEDKGYTYKITDGIYFDTSKFSKYADFAELDLKGQEEGARVEENPEKKNPSDFALWKFSPVDEKRDMEWDSPWGKGFPGWHLECSVMIHELLGQPIDVHAGGIDHLPVHHTNEIAQSEAAYDKPLAKYWMHCNHIQVNGHKMSKSLGNFYTLENIEDKNIPLVVYRLHVLSGHYRSQSEFSWDTLEATRNRLQNWIDKLCQNKQMDQNNSPKIELEKAKQQLLDTLTNDLNTPLTLSVVDEQISLITSADVDIYVDLLNQLLGINLGDYIKSLSDDEVNIINDRATARKNSDWSLSDKLRNDLQSRGILVKDTADGQIWSRSI